VSSRTARATQRNPVSKNQKKKRKKKKRKKEKEKKRKNPEKIVPACNTSTGKDKITRVHQPGNLVYLSSSNPMRKSR